MSEHEPQEEFSLKNYFIPFTKTKAITWIILIGLAVYANFLFNAFVWDDVVFIVNNPAVHSLNIIQLFSRNLFNDGGYYRPIPALYFATLYSLFQVQPFFYHLLQISLHIAVTSLVFILFAKFFNKQLSFILALIFLVHPINVESVGFVGATQSEIYALFGFIALLLSMKIKNLKGVVLVGVFLLLALLTKEVALVFLFLVVLWQVLYKTGKVKLLGMLTGAVLLIYCIIRFLLARIYLQKASDNLIDRLPFGERILNIPAIVWYYLKTFLFPKDLAILQQWTITKVTPESFYFPLLFDLVFLLLLALFSYYIFKKRTTFTKTYIFFIAWFLLGMGFILQIFPLDQTVADRWFYFPIVGLLGIIGILFQTLRIKVNNVWVLSIAFLILMLLSTRTIIRSFDWRDSMTLDSHDASISTNSWALENDLAAQYSKIGDYKQALMHEKKSIQIDPTAVNYTNLGILYAGMGNFKQAKEVYLHAIKLSDYSRAYESLAYLDTNYGDPKENIDYIKNIALNKFPQDATLWLCLAILEYNQGDKISAKMHITTALNYLQSSQTISVYNAIMKGELKKIIVSIRK